MTGTCVQEAGPGQSKDTQVNNWAGRSPKPLSLTGTQEEAGSEELER